MTQPRFLSALEATVSTLLGVVLSILAVQLAFPLFGVRMDAAQNLTATALMTGISFVRQYIVRRAFARMRHA